jgi:hypothetical protein
MERKAIDLVCPICSAPIGARCPGELHFQRIALAVRLTREQNAAMRREVGL